MTDETPRKTTTDGRPPIDPSNPGAPGPINPATGQHEQYWVLSPEERAKGFVRPVRTTYLHEGLEPPANLRDLSPEEIEKYREFGYIKYEEYGPERDPLVGRYWTQKMLDSIKGCGKLTSMSRSIAETYARDPKFYGSTFCCHCMKHLPVAEFTWEGTDDRVGS